jgi:phosphoribosylaminoimidazole (AIR) synthetase
MDTRHFKYTDELTDWVNSNIQISQIISIASAGVHSEGYVLFYKLKP